MSRLINQVVVAPSGSPLARLTNTQHHFAALWDTGATNSMITERVATMCALTPIGITHVATAGGPLLSTPTFLIDVGLPNNVVVEQVTVAQGNLSGIDLLIGMDIILLGDFAVTNYDGITSFSFRIPSSERLDFTRPVTHTRAVAKTNRNAPCYCGSGKKFKYCHGKSK